MAQEFHNNKFFKKLLHVFKNIFCVVHKEIKIITINKKKYHFSDKTSLDDIQM